MDDFLKAMGCTVITTIAMSFPAMLALSFVYEWSGFIQLILCICTVGVAAIIILTLYLYDGGG